MDFSLDLKRLEKLIPKSQPMAGRWLTYQCEECRVATLLDERVMKLPGVQLLNRSRLLGLHCKACGSAAMRFRGH